MHAGWTNQYFKTVFFNQTCLLLDATFSFYVLYVVSIFNSVRSSAIDSCENLWQSSRTFTHGIPTFTTLRRPAPSFFLFFPARFQFYCMLYKEGGLGTKEFSLLELLQIKKKAPKINKIIKRKMKIDLNLNLVHAKKLRFTSICMRVRWAMWLWYDMNELEVTNTNYHVFKGKCNLESKADLLGKCDSDHFL